MRLFAWGANGNGQLGLDHVSEQESSPTEISLPPILSQAATKPIDICGGAIHTLLLVDVQQNTTEDEEGTMTEDEDQEAIRLVTLPLTDTFQVLQYPQVQKISSGFEFNFCILKHCNLLSFGDNSYNQLGRVINETEQSWDNRKPARNSINWKGLDDQAFEAVGLQYPFFQSISPGMRHAAGISADKDLIVWGDNSKFQLGIYTINEDGQEEHLHRVELPRRVDFPFGFRFTKVASGKDFTIALHDSGCLFGCGQNKNGVLLHAPQDIKEFRKFTHIFDHLSSESDVLDMKAGWSHVIVLLMNGKVMSWGRNNFGQLGRCSVNPQFDVEPGYVNFPEQITSIKCGSEHNLALGMSGRVYAWGWNEHDNCGVKVDEYESINEQIQFGFDESSHPHTLKTSPWKKDCILFPSVVPFPEDVKIKIIGCGAGSSFAASD